MELQKIGDSELIITPRNTIYHIDLAPEQLADTIITVGDPGRVSVVSSYFDSIEHKASHREFVSHTGFVGKKKITVISTGIGPDNIDIVLNELDALANIDFTTRTIKNKKKQLTIIRLGTSGALQQDIPVDSFVVSSMSIGLDNLMHYYQYENSLEEQAILTDFSKHIALPNNNIVPYIANSAAVLSDAFFTSFYHGITVTCPGFYGPQGRILRGELKYPQLIDKLTSFSSHGHRVTNFEMETSAIYGLGKMYGHNCLSVSTIVANRIDKKFSTDGDAAVRKMIAHSLPIIEKLP